MANTFDFIGFNGIKYELPALPDNFFNYKHFYVRCDVSGNAFTIYCFNEKIECDMYYNSTWGRLIFDNGSDVSYFKCNLGDSSWKERILSSGVTEFLRNTDSYNVYSCDDLAPYYDKLYKNSLVLELADHIEEDNSFVLVPLLGAEQNVYMNVFGEIFNILPVLLVFLISFIGIRKGISYLFSLLRRS